MDGNINAKRASKPGRHRELFTPVSRLHGTLLERTRPLWEMHLIKGNPLEHPAPAEAPGTRSS